MLTIEIPPLRERIADLPLLVQHFLQRQGSILGRSLAITPEALEALSQYNWPGNVRELENMLERVTYLTTKPTITIDDLPIEIRRTPDAAIYHTESSNGNVARAAALLGISRTTLWRKMVKYELAKNGLSK